MQPSGWMRFLNAFEISQQRVDFVRAQHKHRHIGVTDDNAFRERFFEVAYRVVFRQLPEGLGILVGTVTGRPYGVAGGTPRLGVRRFKCGSSVKECIV